MLNISLFNFEREGKYVIIAFIVLIIAAIVGNRLVRNKLDTRFSVISTGEVKFIYEQNGLHTAMIEVQTETELVTIRVPLLFIDFKNEILNAFPQKKFPVSKFSLSEKTYMNTKGYEKWVKQLPYGFEYPKVVIQYNEKNPRGYYKLLSMDK